MVDGPLYKLELVRCAIDQVAVAGQPRNESRKKGQKAPVGLPTEPQRAIKPWTRPAVIIRGG
jgi:hypothetical protein